MHPELEKYLLFLEASQDPNEQQRSLIDDRWQGGIEQLGFLFQLDNDILMRKLVPQLEGYLMALHGQEPSSVLKRSSFYEKNLPLVLDHNRDELREFLGSALGEMAVEYGWTWCSTDGYGLVVRNPTGFAVHVFPLMAGLLKGTEPVELVQSAARWFAEHGVPR